MNVSTLALYQSLSNDFLILEGSAKLIAPELGSYFEYPYLEGIAGIQSRAVDNVALAQNISSSAKMPSLTAQVSVFINMLVESFATNENDVQCVLPSILALSQCIKSGWVPSNISKVQSVMYFFLSYE